VEGDRPGILRRETVYSNNSIITRRKKNANSAGRGEGRRALGGVANDDILLSGVGGWVSIPHNRLEHANKDHKATAPRGGAAPRARRKGGRAATRRRGRGVNKTRTSNLTMTTQPPLPRAEKGFEG